MASMKIQAKHITFSMQVLLEPSIPNFGFHHFPSYPLTAKMHGSTIMKMNVQGESETTRACLYREEAGSRLVGKIELQWLVKWAMP